MWEEIIKSFKENPRDVHTKPLSRRPVLWFNVYVENGKLYVDRAKTETPSSSLTKRRCCPLDQKSVRLCMTFIDAVNVVNLFLLKLLQPL